MPTKLSSTFVLVGILLLQSLTTVNAAFPTRRWSAKDPAHTHDASWWTVAPKQDGKWTAELSEHSQQTPSWTPNHPHPPTNPNPLHLRASEDHGTTCASSSEKHLWYVSNRCNGRIISACCPADYQDALSEDCVQMPRCKRDPKDGRTPKREWESVLPIGAKDCGKGFTAVPGFYGVCVEGSGFPENMKNGKCTGYGGNLCLDDLAEGD